MNISAIREANQNERMERLIQEVCGVSTDECPKAALDIQQAMRKVQDFVIKVEIDETVRVVPRRTEKKVVITEVTGYFTKKPVKDGDGAYDFLRDYLGIYQEDPLSFRQMRERYPALISDTSKAEGFWYSTIAEEVLKVLRQEYLDLQA